MEYGSQHVCYRHMSGGAMNVAYIDGHVATLRASEVLSWHAGGPYGDARFMRFATGQ